MLDFCANFPVFIFFQIMSILAICVFIDYLTFHWSVTKPSFPKFQLKLIKLYFLIHYTATPLKLQLLHRNHQSIHSCWCPFTNVIHPKHYCSLSNSLLHLCFSNTMKVPPNRTVHTAIWQNSSGNTRGMCWIGLSSKMAKKNRSKVSIYRTWLKMSLSRRLHYG